MIEKVKTFYIWIALNHWKTISEEMINKIVEIGSSWTTPLSNLKYDVVLSSLMTHDSWLVNNVLIQSMKILAN